MASTIHIATDISYLFPGTASTCKTMCGRLVQAVLDAGEFVGVRENLNAACIVCQECNAANLIGVAMDAKQEALKQKARERAAKLATPPTPGQINFLEILLNDCGYTNRKARNAFLSEYACRDIRSVGMLTFNEAAALIEKFQKQRRDAEDAAIPPWKRKMNEE